MTEETLAQVHRFPETTTAAQLAAAVVETPELFLAVVDTEGLSAVNLPGGFVPDRFVIADGHLFLIAPDGQVVVLLTGAQSNYVIQVDGFPIAASTLVNAMEALGDWDTIGETPSLSISQMLDVGNVVPGAGGQEPVRVGNPLIGLDYNPLLPFTDYPPILRRIWDYGGGLDDDGVPEPGDNTITLKALPVGFETDAPIDLRPASFVQFNLPQENVGETISLVTFELTGLPLGTTANFGEISDAGGTATLMFTGSEATFEALVLTLPTDFSTQSRNDAPTGPLQAKLGIETTFLGEAEREFPIVVFTEGDANIDDTPADTIPDESDAPITFLPSGLLVPQVTDIDGSEDYELLELVISGLPAGSTVASLGLSVPTGAVAAVTAGINGSATLTITMWADQVADIQAAYDGLALTLPTDFSTQSRTDLTSGTSLPLTLTLSIETDENRSVSIHSASDGLAMASRVVDINAEGDLSLSGPGTITLDENDAPGDTDEDNTTSTPLDFRPVDAVTGRATDQDGSESIATVDVTIEALPANTQYSINGGLSFQSAPAGPSFTLSGLTFAQYQALVIRLPNDFSTVTPLIGRATFTTDEALLAGESDTGPDDGVETGTFSITVNSEQDIEITTQNSTVIEDVIDVTGNPIPLNLRVNVTDIDGSEQVTSIVLDFANLPAGNTVLSDGTVLNPGNPQWTGDLATAQALAITSLPQHYSGIIRITATVDTNEGDPNVETESFILTVTPVAEPTIVLSLDDSTANVDQIGADNYTVDEDTSFLLLIDAQTPDQDGSEALTQIVIENLPVGWLAHTGGTVSLDQFEQGAADIASATLNGTTLTIELNPGVTDFDGALRLMPLADDDRDVQTILGADLIATVTSLDQKPPLPSDTATATDTLDVDVDAVVDGLDFVTNNITRNENINGRRRLDVDLSGIALEDDDGSETISGLTLTINVATASDAFDPSDTRLLQLRVSEAGLEPFVTITQTGATASSVTYSLTPAPGVSQAQFINAIEALETVVPQHFSGILTLDGELAWNETTTGDVEDDTSDNFATGRFQIIQTVEPRAEAELTAAVFVLSAGDVAAGSPTEISANIKDGSISRPQILTLLESTADGSGPGQVDLFVRLEGETPDKDGSEQLGTLVIANVPSDWIADNLTGQIVNAGAFFAADGMTPLDAAELSKIQSATYDASTGELTLTFVPDVTAFTGALLLRPTLYEDYDVDRNNTDMFTSAGVFFGDDLTITLTTTDTNTATTDDQSADASFDVDVDPINNVAIILALPEGNEGEIDAAGGIWQIPFQPTIQDQDGSERITAVVLREVPQGITIWVPDPNNPGGPKVLAELTEINVPPGFNSWSLENGGWEGAEVRGIPLHFAGPVGATIEVVTTEADGGGTGVTVLAEQLYIDPVVDGGDPSESYTTFEDTAIAFPLDGNLIDNPTNSPESPEAILDVVILGGIVADSGGRVPRFFSGQPGLPGTMEIDPSRITPLGSLELSVSEASNLWVLPGQDSNEDFVFEVTLIYYETLPFTDAFGVITPPDRSGPLDPEITKIVTGTATLSVTGVADTPTFEAQDETAYAGAINAAFDPTGQTDGRLNSDLIYGYAGFSSAPFLLNSRLQDGVIQSGSISGPAGDTFTTNGVTLLNGEMTEILVPQGGSAADFDGSETIYYLITGVTPGTSFANATPLDATGESYLVTESQLPNLQFVPTSVAQVTYYNLTVTTIVTEDDADLSSVSGLTPAELIQQIDSLVGAAAVSEEISIVVLPSAGGGGGCTDDQKLPLPTLELVGRGDEDTEIAFQIKVTGPPPYDSIDDLVNFPNGVNGSFGLGIELPPGASLSSDPPGAVLFDPITGQYAIDLSVLGVDPGDPTLTLGSILFTPPPHASSPNPFPQDQVFGPEYPNDGLDQLEYSIIFVNTTCGTTMSSDPGAAFAITIDPVVDGPRIVVMGTNTVLEDTPFTPNIEIQGIDPGERLVGDIIIEVDGANGGRVLDGSGNPIAGTPVAGGFIAYAVSEDQLATLQITANEHYSGPLEYRITATSQDVAPFDEASTTITQTLMIVPVADEPDFVVNGMPVDPDVDPTPVIIAIEDTPLTLADAIQAGSPDQDGSEDVTLVLSGVPDYLLVTGPSGGFINNGDGSYTISEAAFGQVRIVLRDEHARTPDLLDDTLPSEIPLTLTVNTLEIANSDSNSSSLNFLVRVLPDADEPTVTADITPTQGVEDDGTVYMLDISGSTPDPHEQVDFQITVPVGGRIFVGGVEQPVVGGIVTVIGMPGAGTGGGNTFVPTGPVTFVPGQDQAGDITLEVVAVSTDTAVGGGFADTETSDPVALDLIITPALDLDLTVAPDPEAVIETGNEIEIELGIDADVTDVSGLETLDEVVVTFDGGLPPGATVSDGVLSPDRTTLTLSRGALTSAEFVALVAMVTITLPADFVGAVEGSVTATTNHGTSPAEPFSITVNDLPEVAGPVMVTSTDPVFFISYGELLSTTTDMDMLSIANVTSNDPGNVIIDEQANGVQITVPNGYVGMPVLTYNVVDDGTPPATVQATAELDIDTLQMESTGTTITDPNGAVRDLLDDVTGAVGGTDIAKGTAGNDGVVLSATNPYAEIEGFRLLAGEDFIDLSQSSVGFEIDLGANDDLALGSMGDDSILGGLGADTLSGGAGADTLEGGSGADIFVMTDLTLSDVITDYDRAEGDQIDLTALVTVNPPNLGLQVTYDDGTGELDVGGNLAVTVNISGSGFPAEVEVIFNDANGAQQTAVI